MSNSDKKIPAVGRPSKNQLSVSRNVDLKRAADEVRGVCAAQIQRACAIGETVGGGGNVLCGAGVVAVQQEALKEAEHKVELAEQASADANNQLQQALADKEHLIKGRAYGVAQIIKDNRAAINAECKRISDVAWQTYNRAVKNTGSGDATVTVTGTGTKK